MTPTLIAFFIVIFLVLITIALLYKSKVDGEISILGMKIKIKASGSRTQGSTRRSEPKIASSEVDIQGSLDDVEIEQVAGRDINSRNDKEEKLPSGNSKVVIDGNLKNVKLNQVAGRDIVASSLKPKLAQQKSKQSKGTQNDHPA